MRGLLLGLILCLCWSVPEVKAETLSLQQAVTLAMQHNFDLRIASLDVERAAAGVVGEEGRFDVSADLALGASGSETPLAAEVTQENSLKVKEARAEASLNQLFASGLQTRLSLISERSDADALAERLDPAYRTYLLLDLTQPLLKDMGFDVNTANLRIAQLRREQVALEYLARAQSLTAEIEQAYLTLAQAEEEYKFAVLARDLAGELLAGNDRKFNAGLIPVTEVSEARAAMAGRQESLLLAEQKKSVARNRLLEIIDHGEALLPEDWQAMLPEVEPPLSALLDEALATGFARRPDLAQARLDIEQRKIALVYADNQLLPRLDLEASLGVNGLAGDEDSMGSPYRGEWDDSAYGAFAGDGYSWYAGVRFSMPLQNRAAKAEYRDVSAQNRQALYRLRRAEVSAETAIRSAYATLQLGGERLLVAGQAAALAQTTLDQENRRLEEGLSNSFRVLTFQNALVTAHEREVAARTDYALARSALFKAMGTNLEQYNIFAALPHEGATP